ncbi:MAG TPA: KUP/HAK/KT family potassium transporter [Verrucomicrobiae bacterium]
MNGTTGNRNAKHSSLAASSLCALGVVFGDIGTSPLYTLKTVLNLTGGKPDRAVILGTLSLVIWTLIIVTTIKYVSFAMRIDNDGEGGILALMSLLGVKMKRRPVIVAIGLLGAALIYGDGAVTPAISVLSAVEGLNIVAPAFARYVLPASVVILLALFLIQSQGTARIGAAFGPIMLLWFVTIALLGIWGIARHPSVLLAINPIYGVLFLTSGGWKGFLVLGGIFLCVTGAEALYTDMGQFGARPIRLSWMALVFPSLLLNYAGQAALVLDGAPTSDNIFYRLCPSTLRLPLVVLATIATIIASQSIITGTFTMTRQAIQLGWMPRLKVTQTSAAEYGQIYVGAVNWMLMVVTCGLALAFKKSDNLAAAYGIAVSATMLATSVLLFIAMREIWKWSALRAGLVAGVFIIVDGAFLTANSTKIMAGGYVPLLVAAFVYGVMLIWHRGTKAVARQIQKWVMPIGEFTALISKKKIPRVPGTAVYLTRTKKDASPVMVWNLEHNRALHERLLALTVEIASTPRVSDAKRLTVTEVAPKFWRASATYGFMERVDFPALLQKIHQGGCGIDLSDVTYYVGYENVVPRRDGKGLPRWFVACYAAMQRNSTHLSDFLGFPSEGLVEIGRQIAI